MFHSEYENIFLSQTAPHFLFPTFGLFKCKRGTFYFIVLRNEVQFKGWHMNSYSLTSL